MHARQFGDKRVLYREGAWPEVVGWAAHHHAVSKTRQSASAEERCATMLNVMLQTLLSRSDDSSFAEDTYYLKTKFDKRWRPFPWKLCAKASARRIWRPIPQTTLNADTLNKPRRRPVLALFTAREGVVTAEELQARPPVGRLKLPGNSTKCTKPR